MPKKTVTNAVFNAAKTVGKGAFKLVNPIGKIALAYEAWKIVDALAKQQGFSWDDERGDWVRPKDDTTFLIVATGNQGSAVSTNTVYDYAAYERLCKRIGTCQAQGFVQGAEAANAARNAYCQQFTFGDKQQYHFDSVGWSGFCYSKEKGQMSGTYSIQALAYADWVPYQKSDFDEVAEAAADAAVAKWIAAGGLTDKDFSKPIVLVLDGEKAQTPPYTDPKTGKPVQAEYEFDTKPDPKTGEPVTSVREKIIPRPDLTPDSPEAPRPDPNAVPKDGTGTGGDSDTDKDKPKEKRFDLCKEHPDIVACDKQPSVPDTKELEIPTETKTLNFQPELIFPNTGVCPAPVAFTLNFPFIGSKSFAWEYTYICLTLERIRGIIIACAWLASLMLVIRAMRTT